MDCIGRIHPPASKGHKYRLCIVDSRTQWPAVYPLKRLDARKVCDAIAVGACRSWAVNENISINNAEEIMLKKYIS